MLLMLHVFSCRMTANLFDRWIIGRLDQKGASASFGGRLSNFLESVNLKSLGKIELIPLFAFSITSNGRSASHDSKTR